MFAFIRNEVGIIPEAADVNSPVGNGVGRGLSESHITSQLGTTLPGNSRQTGGVEHTRRLASS